MREVLFRGKAKRNDSCMHGGYWVEGDLEHLGDMICIMACTYNGFDTIEVVPETVGQYTGLKDKTGRKIFEGDIVSCPSNVCRPLFNYDTARETYIYEVVYQDELTAFIMKNKDKQALSYEYLLLVGTVDKCEVIGNIYDNPELLSRG